MRATAQVYRYRDFAMVAFIAAIFILAVVYSVFSATTISDNISTGGTITGGVTSVSHLYASSTVQATLNGFFYASVGVGGTTSPGAALSVTGAGLFTATSTIVGGGLITEGVTAPGILGFYTKNTNAPRMVIDSSGNIGVSTSGPGALLSVAGAGLYTATSTILGGGLITEGVTAPGILGFYTKNTNAPRMVIDSSGNIGVSTSGPGALLSVAGASLFTSTSTILGGGLITEGVTAPGILGFYTRGTDAPRMVIDSSGNIGVGTTSPAKPFAVNGSFLAHGTSTIEGAGLIAQGLFSTSTLTLSSGSATRLSILDGGFVGVGTTSPGALLSVAGAGLYTATSTILGGGLITEGVTSPGILGFYTRGTDAPRMVIDSSGNVGVATSGPTTTFSTVGSGYFTSGLGVGNATTGSGNLLVNNLAVIRGRAGVNATTSPYQEFGVAGDAVFGGDIGTSTVSIETTTGSRGSCIELRDGAADRWIRIYPGGGAGIAGSAAFVASTSSNGVNGVGLLVIEAGRCEGGTD